VKPIHVLEIKIHIVLIINDLHHQNYHVLPANKWSKLPIHGHANRVVRTVSRKTFGYVRTKIVNSCSQVIHSVDSPYFAGFLPHPQAEVSDRPSSGRREYFSVVSE
jgi:hypothetical protein